MKNKIYIAAVFAFLMTFLPWEQIKNKSFEDLQMYKKTYEIYQKGAEVLVFSGPKEFLLHEGFWTFLLVKIPPLFNLNIQTFFSSISILFFFLASLAVCKNNNLNFLFLVNPIFIDTGHSAIRNCLAFAILYYCIFLCRNKSTKIFGFLIAPLIHISSFLIIWPYSIQKSKFSNFTKISLTLAPLLLYLLLLNSSDLTFLGKRFSKQYLSDPVGIKFQSIWIALLVISFFQSREFVSSNLIGISVLLYFLFSAQFIGHCYRIIGVGMPWVVILIKNLKPHSRIIFIFLFLTYFLIFFYYWTK